MLPVSGSLLSEIDVIFPIPETLHGIKFKLKSG